MTGDAQIIHDLGLLSWKTAEVGFRRRWIDGESVAELAVLALSQTATTDSELAALSVAGTLAHSEIEDLLGVVADRLDPVTDEATVIKRWMLGRLIGLRRRSLDDEWLLDRIEEAYAEFGYPEELDGVSRYNFTPEERATDLAIGDQSTSPLEALDRAVMMLQEHLRQQRG